MRFLAGEAAFRTCQKGGAAVVEFGGQTGVSRPQGGSWAVGLGPNRQNLNAKSPALTTWCLLPFDRANRSRTVMDRPLYDWAGKGVVPVRRDFGAGGRNRTHVFSREGYALPLSYPRTSSHHNP